MGKRYKKEIQFRYSTLTHIGLGCYYGKYPFPEGYDKWYPEEEKEKIEPIYQNIINEWNSNESIEVNPFRLTICERYIEVEE